ncbi:MAG: DUF3106 domain-containing protein [Limisphaerales bacterium]
MNPLRQPPEFVVTGPPARSTHRGESVPLGNHLRLRIVSLLVPLALSVSTLFSPAHGQPPIPGARLLPPPPPLPTSPVAAFRHWLSLPPAERDQALETRPPRQREFLRTRLAAYEAMDPRVRDERLRATDLYWHLQQLIRRAPSERTALLDAAPADLQPVLRMRLVFWDQVSPADRAVLLENEGTLRYLAQLKTSVPPPLPPTRPSPGPASVAAAPSVPLRVQAELSKLSQLAPDDLDRIQENWRRFFEGSAPRRERALQEMSAQERSDMERVLVRFRRLNPEQRRSCVESFTRLATMAPAERSQFLRLAERWSSLPSSERDAWRQIVDKLPLFPPLPGPAPASEPPLPQTNVPRRVTTAGTATP